VQNLLNDLYNKLISVDEKPDVELSPELALTQWKLQHKSNLAEYKASAEFSLEQLRSVIVAGQAALKSAILINGGAAVALLDFYRKMEQGQKTCNV
jgi:hypothetical protein